MANPAKKREARKINYTKPKERIAEREKGWTPTTFRIPDGMETFKFRKEKTYRLTIVPFVAGAGNPCADEGQVHYERTFHIYTNIGPEEKAFCAPAKTFGKPDPIQQHLAVMRRQGTLTEETEKALRPKERQLWLVIDHDERDKGIQIFECAHFGKGAGFGEMLDNKLDAASDDSPYQNFFHLGMDGMTLVVKTKKDSFNGREFYKPINMELVPRRNSDSVPESILEQAPCLDDLLIEPTFEELHAAFHGEGGEQAPEGGDEPAEEPEETPAEEGDGDEPAEADLEVGATVEFMLKGKMVEGVVASIQEDAGTLVAQVPGQPKPLKVKIDDVTLVSGPEEGSDGGEDNAEDEPQDDDLGGGEGDGEAEPEGEEEGEGGDDEAAGEDEEGGEGGEGDDAVEDADDEDLPFDADDDVPVDDEPEPTPPPKKPAPKTPAKPAPKAPPAKPAAAPKKPAVPAKPAPKKK